MELRFKQKMFSLMGKYSIYNALDQLEYTIQGKFSFWGKHAIYDKTGREVALLVHVFSPIHPTYKIYINGEYIGKIWKKISILPKFGLDCKGWTIKGDIMGWDYDIIENGQVVATIQKQVIALTDVYTIKVPDDKNNLPALLVVLAIDNIKATRKSNH